jgi:hypothetical protein
VQGADDVRLDGLDGIILVMDRRRRTGKVVDLVHLQEDRLNDVVPYQFEIGILQQCMDVPPSSGKKIVQTEDLMPLAEQTLAEMGPEETGASSNKYSHH